LRGKRHKLKKWGHYGLSIKSVISRKKKEDQRNVSKLGKNLVTGDGGNSDQLGETSLPKPPLPRN